MKSYFLDGLRDAGLVQSALARALPGQEGPWLLRDDRDEPIAYFNLSVPQQGALSIQGDISGRYFDEDRAVVELLMELQSQLGGVVNGR